MHFLDQIANEKDILAKRKAEGRNDLTARIVISRIETEIKRLERRQKAYERKNAPTRVDPYRPKNGLTTFIRRNWAACYEYYYSVLGVFTGTEPSQKEGAK